jgi:hypothetical protein
MNNTKVIDNFKTFQESITTPLDDQRFRSYDLYKIGGVAGNFVSWTDPESEGSRGFCKLSNEG